MPEEWDGMDPTMRSYLLRGTRSAKETADSSRWKGHTLGRSD
jgi:hypothetical protein